MRNRISQTEISLELALPSVNLQIAQSEIASLGCC
jgi:hypothetical protein